MSRLTLLLLWSIAALPGASLLTRAALHADDWPGWRGPQRDGVWHETGVVDHFQDGEAAILWRTPIGGGYGSPSVSSGRVYVMDRIVEPGEMERVHCLDAGTGKTIWSHWYACSYAGVQYDAGPRAAVSIANGRAYSFGTMGNLFCFDAVSGQVLWQHDTAAEYNVEHPTWGLAASPLIESDVAVVQVGGPEACLVAFGLEDGKERWRALADRASYSSPIVVDQAGRRVIVAWTGDRVVGLDAKSGEEYWGVPHPPLKWIRNTASPVAHDGRVFLSSYFGGSMLLSLSDEQPTVEVLWKRVGAGPTETDALHTSVSTAALVGNHVYGVDSQGELRCLDAATGDRIWESLEATPNRRWSNIFLVRGTENRWWLLNEEGELIVCELSPEGYKELSRAKVIQPTKRMLPSRRGGVIWSHPAFAQRCIFARSDEEIVCASLAADG